MSPDIAEDQILKAGLNRMLGVPGIDAESRSAIRRQLGLMADVSSLPPHGSLPHWRPNRLNARYIEALELAQLVLRDRSAERGHGITLADGFLVDMEDIFEDFVHAAIGRELVKLGGGRYSKPTWHLDTTERLRLEPDLVWARDGQPVAVVDAKYKTERPTLGGEREDIFQMLGYCMSKDLKEGHLVYTEAIMNRPII